MGKVLVLKTAADIVVDKLISGIQDREKVACLIQTSKVKEYKEKYPNVEFLDIQKEMFWELQDNILNEIKTERYKCIYIPCTDEHAVQFKNVMDIVIQLSFERICFVNCNMERHWVQPKGMLKGFAAMLCIRYFRWLYRERN